MNDSEKDAGFRAAGGYGQRVITALLVVAMGVAFLCGNLGLRIPFLNWANWWAWFILVGAAWPLARAWERYRAVGALDGAVLHSLLSALAIMLVATFFILELSWAIWWPLFVIYGGLHMLVRDPRRQRARRTW